MTPPRLHVKAVSRKPGSPSHEQRVVAYLDLMALRGIDVTLVDLPKGALAQRRVIRSLRDADVVWWHRHLLARLHGPLLSRSARRLVYDFDDPLPLSSRKDGQRDRTRAARFDALLKRCDAAMVGSEYLAALARPCCEDVRIVPMSIDPPEAAPTKDESPRRIELLWVGSAATQPYLESLRPMLARLGAARPAVTLRLVAHRDMRCDPLRVDFRRWSPEQQSQALATCDIGLCPMPDNPWTRGKCPYKVLQYMAHGMAWVGAAVGENIAMAGEGDSATGLCAAGDDAWLDALTTLIDDATTRRRLGRTGTAYIRDHRTRPVIADLIAATLRG